MARSNRASTGVGLLAPAALLIGFQGIVLGQVTLLPAVSPATAEAGLTMVTLTGSGFPAGTISPNQVTVKLSPAPPATGTAVSVQAYSVTTVIATTRRVAFLLPASIVVASPTAYLISISSTSPAFTSNQTRVTVNPPASILSVSPNSGAQGGSVAVQIQGSYSNFFQGSSIVNAGAGIAVSNVTVLSPTLLQARFAISATASPGAYAVSVTTGGSVTPPIPPEVASLGNGFTITGGVAPTITSVNPNTGQQGQILTNVAITGAGTHFTQAPPAVTFSSAGVTASAVQVIDATHLTVTLTITAAAATGTSNITVVAGNETSTGTGLFAVLAGTPVLTQVSPNSGQQGQQNLTVAISGSYTHFLAGTTVANFGAGVTVNTLNIADPTHGSASITLGTTANLGPRTVTMTTGTEVAALVNAFAVVAPLTISALPAPTPNGAGWNNTNVTVSFTCGGGSGTVTCPTPVLVSTEGVNQAISRTATDSAGGMATATLTLKIDKSAPVLTVSSPLTGATVSTAQVTIAGTATDALSGVSGVACNGAAPTVNGSGFSCVVTLTGGANTVNVTATDVAGNVSTVPLSLTYSQAPTVTLTAPVNLSYLNISPTTVNGTVSDSTATVTVNSIDAPVANGQFSVQLPLAEGPNIITATAQTTGGVGTASIEVNLDTTPPHVSVTSPPDKFVTTDTSISVAGIVNDIVVGTVNDQQAQVTVNGAAAQVSNRTFLATNVPLNLGDNVIQAVGRDRVGNAATTQITVTRQVPSAQSQIHLISGNNQTSMIGSVLSAPLVVALTDSAGNLAPNKTVIFKVTQNSGMIAAGGVPAASAVATTNAQGQAQAQWTLGMRAGAGGNTVEAYSVGAGGTAIFNATGNQGPAGNIVIDTGNDQIGAIGQPLPKPVIAVVVDAGNNRLANVPVTFTVKQGGGSVTGPSGTTFTLSQNAEGQQNVTVNSDSDGRVAATLILGLQEGNANNLVEADFLGDVAFPAAFTASGRAAGDPAKTTISGVVLDNSNVPIPGVTIRALLTNVMTSNGTSVNAAATVQSDMQGQFLIPSAPVGFVKLLVDGSTATLPGTYPHLEYDLVTVAGQVNTVGQPIYLLPLNAANQLCATATTGGGTLTIPEAPGFSLTFAPGQVTFPGGTKTGCVGVTVVHGDRVPMAPGFGQQPRFIVTIQPAGAIFNPPAAITLPNVDGLKPREVTEMYSFDHDIGSFVAIGTGTVSDDGQVIRSNPGVGVLKAGWHCGGNPASSGAAATCPTCMFCQGTQCTPQGNGTACGGTGACQFTGPGQQPSCNCPTGQLLVNNSQCQTPPNCPAGTTFNVSTGQCCGNGQCQTPPNCPAGTTFNVSTGQCCGNGQCYTPPNCPIGTSFNASTGQCCGNGQCQTPPNCPPGTTFNVSTGQCCGNGQCQNPPTCTPPQVLVNGQCQTPPNCPAGTTFNVSTGQCCGNGQCQCPLGQVSINGQCQSSCPTSNATLTITLNTPSNDGKTAFAALSFVSSDNLSLQAQVTPACAATQIQWTFLGGSTPLANGVLNPPSVMGSSYSFRTIPPAAPLGRPFALSYRAEADLGQNMPTLTITQDAIDTVRQQYIDLSAATVPDRMPFIDSGTSSQGHFTFAQIKSPDSNWALFSIFPNLEDWWSAANLDGSTLPVIGPSNRGYSTPIHNFQIRGSATNSQHIYGTAADVDATPDTWDELDKTVPSGACVEIKTLACPSAAHCHYHADWRSGTCSGRVQRKP